MPLIEYDEPERFIAGTVGEPGQRTFFLQAVQGPRVTTVSLEKEQVAVLAERLNTLLDEVGQSDESVLPPDNGPLSTPIEDEFRVSTLSLAWVADVQRVVIECHDRDVQLEDSGDEVVELTEPDATVLRIVLSPIAAREFARRGLATVASGRPPCPFCGAPLEASGHICPRANGYRR